MRVIHEVEVSSSRVPPKYNRPKCEHFMWVRLDFLYFFRLFFFFLTGERQTPTSSGLFARLSSEEEDEDEEGECISSGEEEDEDGIEGGEGGKHQDFVQQDYRGNKEINHSRQRSAAAEPVNSRN